MNWEKTLEMAQEKLRERKPEEINFKAQVDYRVTEEEFVVPFLNEDYHVKYFTGEVYHPQGKEVPLVYQILILHYLQYAQSDPLRGEWISFKELPSGQLYIEPFYNRAIRPLLKYFGEEPELLLKAGKVLGGREEKIGDVSVMIPVLPRIPVTFVIWRGDEEFPPSGNVLFDASAPSHLPAEDYAVIASAVVFELAKAVG